ncbi:putative methyl-accepting chemotaxis sensory transducer [Catenovulum agarivorans DS-2]|uniref:Putative methyl-accepting chemotaxis sensory transducer n=1 Tax=Catenovulum agarivorans DS-2 TaxID=1328313 RepID=W7QLI4_9ALTE|nr:methyl-accepting chemotaxis protein [Catenovulum agarivorans]EWH09797.1 putative methyl-accepting chemotaxis sensory transducer [Catenovulum agarivorans DS-2]
MSFLNTLSLKSRITALVIIPLLVVAWLSFERYQQASLSQQNLAKIGALMELISQSSHLLTALQNERDYSFGYVNSKKARYGKEMTTARAKTDQQIIRFKQAIAERPELTEMSSINNKLKVILGSFDELTNVRAEGVDQLTNKLTSGKFTFRTYKDRNTKIIQLVEEIIALADDKELSNKATVLHAQMMAKDIYSEMRGLMYGAFVVKGTMGPARFRHFVNIEAVLSEYQAKIMRQASPDVRSIINRINSNPNQSQVVGLIKTLLQKLNERLTYDADEYFSNISQLIQTYQTAEEHVLEEIEHLLAAKSAHAQYLVNSTLILAIVLLIVIAAISILLIRSVTVPLTALVSTCLEISQSKDISKRVLIQGTDEISEVGNALNSLLCSFDTALTQVYQQTQQMNEIVAQVNTASNTSLQLSTNQNDATDNVSVAMNEMTASICEVAQNTQQTSDAVQRAHDFSVDCADMANHSQSLISNLITELGATSDLVNRLNEQTNSISSVITVIQAIAEQTNLLALNAAIEAARAGDQGRGFAVVADEVRGLASRTQESTKQIEQQIESLLTGSDQADQSMGALKATAQKAIDVVLESVAAFGKMKDELDVISDMSSQIATAAEEQTSVSNEINERIHAVRHDAEQMAEHAQTGKNSSASLTTACSTLKTCVNQFTVS